MSWKKTKKGLLLLAAAPAVVAALNPGCAPGSNFDLSKWNLQLPTGKNGPTTVTPAQLQGCSGFQDQFFFTASGDGSLVMTVPGSPSSSGCVTTPNSQHCRTELREIAPGSWDPNGPVNRLRVTLAVPQPDDSAHGTVVGQIHIDDSVSSKPVCELYYNANGDLTMGVEQTRAGGNEVFTPLGNVPVGRTFTYEIRYERGVLSVSIGDAGFQTLSTFSLDNPPSYFKVGNYNQGNAPSEVHFFSIFVTHSASSATPPPPPGAPASSTSAQPLSTISLPGLGPVEVLYQLQPTAAPTCDSPGAQPTVASDATVNLALYDDAGCCNPLTTTKLGNLDECKTLDGGFEAFEMAVGQNLFGRGIHVQLFSDASCQSQAASFSLTNAPTCWTGSGGSPQPQRYRSYQISNATASTPPPPPPAQCAFTQPAVGSDNTVTLALFSDSDCCTPEGQTFKIGNLDECKTAKMPFEGFTQAVGQNMFGRGIHIQTFAQAGCVAPLATFDLTNAATCWTNGQRALSFVVTNSSAAGEVPPTAQCGVTPPAVSSNTTVTLELYGDGGCCGAVVEHIKLGNLDVCKKADAPAMGFTQAVGQGLFGRGIHVVFYEDDSCGSDSFDVFALQNAPVCWPDTGRQPWGSFKITQSQPLLPPSPPSCSNPAQPSIASDNTVTLNLFSAADCCAGLVETIKIGNLGVCHNADAPFRGLTQGVGQNLFGRGSHIQVFTGRDCGGSVAQSYSLSNADACSSNGGQTFQSFMVTQGDGGDGDDGNGSGSSGSSCTPNDQPSNPSDNTVTLNLFSQACCTTAHKVKTITVGNLNQCHDVTASFAGITETVGANMFGRSLRVFAYRSLGCSDSSFSVLELSNADVCYFGDTWKSFQLAPSGGATAPAPPPPPPPSNPTCGVSPKNSDDNALTLDLWTDTACCGPVASTVTVTKDQINRCFSVKTAFNAITQAVGQNMFKNGYHIRAYSGTNCGLNQWADIELSNHAGCIFNQGPVWNSFVIHGPAPQPPIVLPPNPQPPKFCGVPPKTPGGSTSLAFNLYSDDNCCNVVSSFSVDVGEVINSNSQGGCWSTKDYRSFTFSPSAGVVNVPHGAVSIHPDSNSCGATAQEVVVNTPNSNKCWGGTSWNSFWLFYNSKCDPFNPFC